mmetsp:Transcript_128081/g.343697  ORF Transcript_128081/g.343697 Transcript_128081/m.343697 type:complete len:225 (+) Transcript_128081:92-766(+)
MLPCSPAGLSGSLLLVKHRGLQPRGGLLHVAGRVELVLLALRLREGRGRLVHRLLGFLRVDRVDRLEVVDQDRERVRVHGGEAAHDDQRHPLAVLLVADHARVQGGHHRGVVGEDAQLAAGAGEHHLAHGQVDARALGGLELHLDPVGRHRFPLLGEAGDRAAEGLGRPGGAHEGGQVADEQGCGRRGHHQPARGRRLRHLLLACGGRSRSRGQTRTAAGAKMP